MTYEASAINKATAINCLTAGIASSRIFFSVICFFPLFYVYSIPLNVNNFIFFFLGVFPCLLFCQILEDFMKQNTQRSQGFIDFKHQAKPKNNVVEVRRKLLHNYLDCFFWIQIICLSVWQTDHLRVVALYLVWLRWS